MKGFLTKKLPAFALAVMMVVSLMPAAMATDCGHNNWSSWQKLNDTQHQRKCLTSGCPGTQEANHNWSAAYETDASTHWKKCADCGAQTTHESHVYNGAMKYDASNHWDQCTVCGYRENLGGHVDLNNDGKCDTCGYSTGTANITVTFMNGAKTYQTQSVKKDASPSNPGTPTKSSSGSTEYTFKGWSKKDPGTSALYDGQSYLSSSEVSKTALSSNTTYYALYTKGTGDLTWKVKPGNEIKFDRSDFKDLYEDQYDDTFLYVNFEADSSLKTSNGVLYSNRAATGEKTFSKSDLEDYDFYYSKSKYGDYSLDSLSFVAGSDAKGKTVSLDFTLYGEEDELEGTLEIEISSSTSSSSSGDITYKVDVKDDVSFDRSDFKELFDDEYDDDDTFRYLTFSPGSSYKSSNGYLYYDYDGKEEEKFTKAELEDNDFYYSSSKYGDYPIEDLSFVSASGSDGETVTLDFTLYGDDEELEGTLKILIGDADDDDEDEGDITYTLSSDKEADFDRTDFSKIYKEDADGSVRYVKFYPDSAYKSADGYLYYDYDGKNEEKFTKSDLEEYEFYYSSSDYGDYALSDLTFVASSGFDEALSIDFRVYGDNDKYVKGTLVIQPAKSAIVSGTGYGNIRYYVTTGTAVQINANDISRFFKKQYPGSTLQSVELIGVPSSGALYYNYYASDRKQLTAGNCDDQSFYLSPTSSQYDLNQLTYIPSGSNYCGSIPFTATGSNSKSVQGSILISVTRSAVSEVYGVTPKNTAVSLPASAIYNAVYNATGTGLASIQLLELPTSNVGAVNVSGTYVSLGADIATRYTYGSGTQQMSQLKFVPASGYTGSAEIPYVAYDTAGNAIASGKFCLGIVNSVKRFSDVSSSTWCYKYVTELSDAGVIGGYSNGSFRPDNTVTYGAALKLIMLAAGYSEQAPTGSHTFSGYLSKAQADGLVSGSVNLDSSITRLQVSQLAAKAMKLNVTNLSSNRPFTDTADVYVQALNAAGIVEGYFSNGTSTFKPGNTLTRGQIAAIVWRMQNYNG
ncbi:S-layer homology domain-containing protein [Oscillibacter sp.]|uniref:S-layer homology domain-containing protein n=1 Tax=Oscillibacter sp. TaxID=1945593 RepID=UPI0026356C31|nr:S-layer homology domain-containing protein [Oscillibacter sp.]MDD3347566.1 S-layer homology domain-containing protein [Oscillibacter sp.]